VPKGVRRFKLKLRYVVSDKGVGFPGSGFSTAFLIISLKVFVESSKAGSPVSAPVVVSLAAAVLKMRMLEAAGVERRPLALKNISRSRKPFA